MNEESSVREMLELATRMFSKYGTYLFSASQLKDIPLEHPDRDVLQTIGFPREEILQLSFAPDNYGLRRLQSADFHFRGVGPHQGDWVVLAGNNAELICMNVLDGGAVWSLRRTQHGINHFMNSRLRGLVGCLAAYIELFTTGDPDAPESENRRLFEVFIDRISTFDPICLNDPNNYWSIIIQQMEYELAD